MGCTSSKQLSPEDLEGTPVKSSRWRAVKKHKGRRSVPSPELDATAAEAPWNQERRIYVHSKDGAGGWIVEPLPPAPEAPPAYVGSEPDAPGGQR
ncbi:hypothetical protein PUNSTDRAFT_48754 [Punctularia strigosozonata HHB-11173 SS5]|uniref:uncharacterized protein n=1 Tax=Punctularia strigosozonata (strain HHB-11173) TaxID=741275 RepID=UPI00044168D3|nr:uncharacterized protein PUNSTDRAFT_48754 [Punctularia strigosozonata HHB-11173 SS5]EIN13845.1 hypothetical protein PUNSTDRAFT_48754 [Punctularia strigosozonata HHB-11173 SS5]